MIEHIVTRCDNREIYDLIHAIDSFEFLAIATKCDAKSSKIFLLFNTFAKIS
jgi:hypothetical protein